MLIYIGEVQISVQRSTKEQRAAVTLPAHAVALWCAFALKHFIWRQ